MEFREVKRKLELLADRTVDNMKNHIRRGGKNNTGNLMNSVGWKFVPTGVEFYVKAPYSDFVIKGRRVGAKMPPKLAIQKWLNSPHGRSAFNSMKKKFGKQLTYDSANFIIRKSISQHGIKPFDFFNPYINNLYNVSAFHDLEAAYVKDIENELKKIIK